MKLRIRNLDHDDAGANDKYEDIELSIEKRVKFDSDQTAKGTDELDLQCGTYYYPANSNYPWVDSFIVQDNIVYLFQCTVAEKHQVTYNAANNFLLKIAVLLKAGIKNIGKIPLEANSFKYIFIFPNKNDANQFTRQGLTTPKEKGNYQHQLLADSIPQFVTSIEAVFNMNKSSS